MGKVYFPFGFGRCSVCVVDLCLSAYSFVTKRPVRESRLRSMVLEFFFIETNNLMVNKVFDTKIL